jgi:glycosyltransferase involved in cell wall biosynthesis
MRILLLAGNIGRVGDATRAVATGKALAQRGHHATVLYSKADRSLGFRCYDEDGVEIVESPRGYNIHGYSPFQNPWNVLSNLWWLATHTYDVYHAFIPLENVGIPWMIRRCLAPGEAYVYDQSDLIVDGGFLGDLRGKRGLARLSYRLSAWTERTAKRWADAHFVVSRPLQQRAIQQGVSPDRVYLFRMGPSLTAQRFQVVEPEAARARLGWRSPGVLLGYAAMHPVGLEELLSGLKILKSRGHDFHLLFTGTESEGLRLRIGDAGLMSHITITGRLADKDFWLHLSACDILLAPMENSPLQQYCFPSKIVDYMAVGRPIVVGDVGDAGDLVSSHGVGIAYRGGAGGLSQAIIRLASDADSRRAMGERGRAVVSGEFSWRTIAAQMENVYLTILCGKRASTVG